MICHCKCIFICVTYLDMPPRSRRDREARSQLEEEHFTPSELTNVELDADGKPCRACTAAKSTLSSLSLESIAGNKRLDCAPDVNQIGNSSWVSVQIQVYWTFI